MFFGLGWALTSVMGLSYFQSMIIPQSVEGWLYFLTTFIGHYGLILSLVYFILFVPVVSLLPSYYISRLWSIVLILAINLFIFFDSYIFARYRFHVHSFLWNFLQQEDALLAIGITPLKLAMIGFATGALFIFFWVRGEKIWRNMQTRFSNPVSNWYFAIIILCVLASHTMHMIADAKGENYVARIARIFPLHFPITGKKFLRSQGLVEVNSEAQDNRYKEFYYPSKQLSCPMRKPHNILLVVMDKLNEAEINEYQMSNLYHYRSHGMVFKNHYSGGFNKSNGYFSLLYSIAPTYAKAARNQNSMPAFLGQIKDSKVEMNFFQFGGNSTISAYRPDVTELPLSTINSQLEGSEDLAEVNPFAMQVYIETNDPLEKDNQLKSVIDLFIEKGLISNTIIVITATHSNDVKTPMLMIWPGKGRKVVNELTSHYDVLPTIMKEDWKCKNPPEQFSFGSNIFDDSPTNEIVMGTYKNLKILDESEQKLTTIDKRGNIIVQELGTGKIIQGEKDRDLILSTLNKLTKFYRP